MSKPFGQIIIGNKRTGSDKIPVNFLLWDVDRANPILGNKHILEDHRDDIKRAEVLGEYKSDYDADWMIAGPMKQETLKIARRVYKGENIALMCWCSGKPTFKPCHAEQIRDRIAEILKPHEQ